MDLKIKDIVDLLQVSEKTVYRWIKENKIPCYRINHQYRFSRAEINEWILSNKIDLSSTLFELSIAGRPTIFADLLRRGGIYYDIPGASMKEALRNAIEIMKTPADTAKEEIIAALLNREQMMSTAIGKGIAIPHPRNPMITDIEQARVAVCFLQQPIDFAALDGKPVHTLFIVLTSTPKRHLEVLSKISYLCRMDSFIGLLEKRAPADEILTFVEIQEREWRQRSSEKA